MTTMAADARSRALRWLQIALICVGVACLGWYSFVLVEAASFQREQRAALDRMTSSIAAPGIVRALETPDSSLIGTLEIPRLGLSTVIVEGDDDSALDMAVGHLPDTPLPWDDGNSAMAAHRDTYFRPLKDIVPGDVIRVEAPRGTFEYLVKDTRIVNPDDVWVLDDTGRPTLTLITCYPFFYIGNAPHRFIVRAERSWPPSDAR
jgi:sortase A